LPTSKALLTITTGSKFKEMLVNEVSYNKLTTVLTGAYWC